MFEILFNLLCFAFIFAAIAAILQADFRNSHVLLIQKGILRRGTEVEAEILARFEGGAPYGSERAKALQPYLASWDPRELELRYSFDGREIISRGRVTPETFFRTRSMKTLKVKVDPDKPEQWATLA